jgi:uncharacterized protein YjbJ (UPF0337 family)
MQKSLLKKWSRNHGLEPGTGSWKQLEGKIKAKWGLLTGDDLTAINGRREQLEGKLQHRYGWAKDKARKEIDGWFTSQGF